ncbi:MAG: hypothetical protein QOH98_833 [Methylobacteriaceae bacterium]|nr:hypothetical protein [Methylobacteriaceae bacterium]
MNPFRFAFAVFVVAVATALLAGAYFYGAYSYATSRWPINQVRDLRIAGLKSQHAMGIDYDSYARLTGYPEKEPIACPPQTDRTAVFLVIGQSNAANSGGQRFRAESAHVAAYFEGKCYAAESPLLGSSGIAGEPWSAIADRLVDDGSFDQVVLVPAAISATALSEWIAGGELHAMLQQVVQDAQRHYRFTHVLWHQGETDFSMKTTEDAYFAAFQSLARDLHAWGVAAPIYVSVATRCEETDAQWSADNPVSRAQRKLASSGEGFVPGVDSDSFLKSLDRYDGCHMAGSGLAKFIDAWTDILRHKR